MSALVAVTTALVSVGDLHIRRHRTWFPQGCLEELDTPDVQKVIVSHGMICGA